MSTPATICIYDANAKNEICKIHISHDGNPECLGKWLHDNFQGHTITNGYNTAMSPNLYANGMSNLAAQIICRLGTEFCTRTLGQIYINENYEYDYKYTVWCNPETKTVEILLDNGLDTEPLGNCIG